MLKDEDNKKLLELSRILSNETEMDNYTIPHEYSMIQSVMSIINKKDKITLVYFYYQIEMTLIKLYNKIKNNETLKTEENTLKLIIETANYKDSIAEIINILNSIDQKVLKKRKELNFIIKK